MEKQTSFQLQGQDEHVAPVTLPLLLGFPSKAHPGVKVTALMRPLQKVTEQAGTAAEGSLLPAAIRTLTLRAELIRKPSWSQQAEALGPNEASEEGRRPGVFASHLHRVSGFGSLRSMHEAQGSIPALNKAECGTARLKFLQAHTQSSSATQ